MEIFMWVFGIVLFIFSCIYLVVGIYLTFDDKAKGRDKVLEEILQREEYNERLQTNLTLFIFNANVVFFGNLLFSLLGIFFGSVIIYLYK
jgi:hypothetical protein